MLNCLTQPFRNQKHFHNVFFNLCLSVPRRLETVTETEAEGEVRDETKPAVQPSHIQLIEHCCDFCFETFETAQFIVSQVMDYLCQLF